MPICNHSLCNFFERPLAKMCLLSATELFFRTFDTLANCGFISVPMSTFCSLRQSLERHQTEDLARLSPSLYNLSFMSACACESFIGTSFRDPKLTVSCGVRPLRVDHSHISVSRKFWCCSSLSTPRLLYVDAPILIGGRIFCAKSTTLVGCPAGK